MRHVEETGFIGSDVARAGLHGWLQAPTRLFVLLVGGTIELLPGSLMRSLR